MNRNISIIKDENGNSVVLIHNIIFMNKQDVPWGSVERYLAKYVGEIYEVIDLEIVYTLDQIYLTSMQILNIVHI